MQIFSVCAFSQGPNEFWFANEMVLFCTLYTVHIMTMWKVSGETANRASRAIETNPICRIHLSRSICVQFTVQLHKHPHKQTNTAINLLRKLVCVYTISLHSSPLEMLQIVMFQLLILCHRIVCAVYSFSLSLSRCAVYRLLAFVFLLCKYENCGEKCDGKWCCLRHFCRWRRTSSYRVDVRRFMNVYVCGYLSVAALWSAF